MITGDEMVYPDPLRGAEQSFTNQAPETQQTGITLRQYYAGLAMQGIISMMEKVPSGVYKRTAENALLFSDALIEELNKQNP